jgi:hypothetical protein
MERLRFTEGQEQIKNRHVFATKLGKV